MRRRALALLLLAGPGPALAQQAIPLPSSMAELVGGGWRLFYPGGERSAFDAAALPALVEIGRRLAANGTGRVTLVSRVSGGDDPSTARRLTLDRAIAVKAALERGGLPGTRVDIRPLGRDGSGVDAVDILPPGAPRP
jgi:hypothetical protein